MWLLSTFFSAFTHFQKLKMMSCCAVYGPKLARRSFKLYVHHLLSKCAWLTGGSLECAEQ
jgi:hypothetical protein